jgi:flagellar biosynthesis GTPase FlhF
MRIKRFEAHSMAEALRMVKKEFGRDAVILSAKTLKKNKSVFGKRNSGHVVVTAAIDRSPAKTAPMESEQAFQSQPSPSTYSAAAGLDNSLSAKPSILDRFSPITRTGQQKLRDKFMELSNTGYQKEKSHSEFVADQEQVLYQSLTGRGVSSQLAEEIVDQVTELLSKPAVSQDMEVHEALHQVISARHWVAPKNEFFTNKPSTAVLFGAPGAGKTTTAVKLAAESAMMGQKTALLSLDNQRAAGMIELERYARLLKVPVYAGFDSENLDKTLQQCRYAGNLIVDTPGLGPNNRQAFEELKSQLNLLGADTRYLLIPAPVNKQMILRTLELYKPLGVNRLIITQLDWSESVDPWLDIAVLAELPIAFTTDSPLVSESIQTTTSHWLMNYLMNAEPFKEKKQSVTVVSQHQRDEHGDQYVANSNSDIFHRSKCRSVQRISTQNVVIFHNQSDAIEKKYKPCRMCCADLLESKPINRPAYTYRAANRYFAR